MWISCPKCAERFLSAEMTRGAVVSCPRCENVIDPFAAQVMAERVGPCPNCKSPVDAGDFAIGERAMCPVCGGVYRVGPSADSGHETRRLVVCAGCQTRLDISRFAGGEEAACPDCGTVAIVSPIAPRALAPPTAVSILATLGALTALVAVVVWPPLALVGLAFSLAAFVDVARSPDRLVGRRRAAGGAISNIVILLLYLMLVPRPLPDVFYDDDEEQKLLVKKLEVVRAERKKGASARAHYADSLAPLLLYDPNLGDDPGVTFIFGSVDSEGYTFTTIHGHGTRDRRSRSGRHEFVFHD